MLWVPYSVCISDSVLDSVCYSYEMRKIYRTALYLPNKQLYVQDVLVGRN